MSLAKLTAAKLSQDEISELIQRTVDGLQGIPGLERAILFGSAARGEMSEASDLDVVLIFDSVSHAKEGARLAQWQRVKPLWPTDFLSTDRATYETRSHLGGVFFCAREEGRDIF
ncbi:MAG: nucleotidyltransferase domain-containing protein [Deltaproteobacteria bacterium]|nr:nucleotidyltransferase domain-containing protein [Deltaproteobacteria bacterium]MBI3296248.1 nucleotidyltransferase domain-containing protein [Deltaproteobacteria bacterium]